MEKIIWVQSTVGFKKVNDGLAEVNQYLEEGWKVSAGSILTILGVYLGVCKSRNTKERLLSVILTYYGVAVLVFGIMGVS